MVWMDTDLGMAPFVPITEEDEQTLAQKLAEKELPGLDYERRVHIAYYALQNPGWDNDRIQTELDIEHDVVVPGYLIGAFLESIR